MRRQAVATTRCAAQMYSMCDRRLPPTPDGLCRIPRDEDGRRKVTSHRVAAIRGGNSRLPPDSRPAGVTDEDSMSQFTMLSSDARRIASLALICATLTGCGGGGDG